jgi:hypothetical protein
MDRVQAELGRISAALWNEPEASERRTLLHAVQQALVWVLEPDVTKAPFDYVTMRSEADSGDCLPQCRQAMLTDAPA